MENANIHGGYSWWLSSTGEHFLSFMVSFMYLLCVLWAHLQMVRYGTAGVSAP
jgi:hypothetical protein